MAELHLTPEEIAANTWFELSDEVVGKLTKYSAAKMMETCKGHAAERDQVWQFSMMLMMIDWCTKVSATGISQEVKNFFNESGQHGDWKVSVERIAASSAPEEAVHSNTSLPSIDDVLASPGTSYWLKETLASALARDPVDAANDVELLAVLLGRQADDLLASAVMPDILPQPLSCRL